MSKMVLRVPINALIDELLVTHGVTAYDPRVIVLATFIYIHDTYGLEGIELTEEIYHLTVLDETLALDIAGSDAMQMTFSNINFPSHISYLSGIGIYEHLLLMELE